MMQPMFESFLDWYRQKLAIRTVVGFAIMFLMSIALSCREFKYMVFSQTTDAIVYRVSETTTERNRGTKSFDTMYRWQVAGEEEERTDRFSESGQPSHRAGDKIRIDYLDHDSRPAGEINWSGPIMLVFCLVLLFLAALPLILESYHETRTR